MIYFFNDKLLDNGIRVTEIYLAERNLLQKEDFRSKSRHAKKFYRRHLLNTLRLKF